MTYAPSNSETPYLPTTQRFNEKEQFPDQLSRMYSNIAYRLNDREIGIYDFTERLTGQKWTDSNNLQLRKETFRKVFNFTAIAAGATLNIAHGITGIILVTNWFGGVVVAGGFRPLPRVSVTLVTDQIQVDIVGANIVIINGATAPAITSGSIVIEYLKN